MNDHQVLPYCVQGFVVAVVVAQANVLTARVSDIGCEIPGRSGFASHISKALRGWSQSVMV